MRQALLAFVVSLMLPASVGVRAQAVPDWVVSAPRSHAMGVWTPRHARVNELPACTPAFHDTFFVIGPDGARYPTWHPPVAVDPATGVECAFGHEHGRDPRGSQLWLTKQVQRAFYFDADANGRMDPAEEAFAGLPFGYVNAQADRWFDQKGVPAMRHEDHNGHKVEWANGESDIASHRMDERAFGGVWIGRLGDGRVTRDTGIRCFFLGKVHQGTSTGDAFRHNLHEVVFFQDCRHVTDMARCADASLSSCPDSHRMNSRVSMAVLHPFGRPGGFTKLAPLCGEERRNDAQDYVVVGHSQYSRFYPDGAGDREIPSRDCVERGFLVDEPRFSGNAYEAWPASLFVTGRGQPIVESANLLFDVNDAVRYHYPERLKAARGYDVRHPELAGTEVGYFQDLCSERLGTRGARHVACGTPEAAWDDPRSGFRGLNRGMYFMPPVLRNAGSREVWFTDPFGGGASGTPFPGAVRQEISSRDIDYSRLIRGEPIDPRVAMRVHDDGRGTVHAPN